MIQIKKTKKPLSINLLTSKIFRENIPTLINEIVKRGHYLYIFDDKNLPPMETLLNCDVFIDQSAVVDKVFYSKMLKCYNKIKSASQKVPLMVDHPEAIMNSMDKRNTHATFPDLIPESYNLDGINNTEMIEKFINDKYVVIKDPFGWNSIGIERISPKQALSKHKKTKGLIIQKYIPFSDGLTRVLTLNYKSDFEILCAYLRIPNSWRTGIGTHSKYRKLKISKKLSEFIKKVSKKSNIYLNGIDCVYHDGKYVLFEVNTVPGFMGPYNRYKVNTPKRLLAHIERNV